MVAIIVRIVFCLLVWRFRLHLTISWKNCNSRSFRRSLCVHVQVMTLKIWLLSLMLLLGFVNLALSTSTVYIHDDNGQLLFGKHVLIFFFFVLFVFVLESNKFVK